MKRCQLKALKWFYKYGLSRGCQTRSQGLFNYGVYVTSTCMIAILNGFSNTRDFIQDNWTRHKLIEKVLLFETLEHKLHNDLYNISGSSVKYFGMDYDDLKNIDNPIIQLTAHSAIADNDIKINLFKECCEKLIDLNCGEKIVLVADVYPSAEPIMFDPVIFLGSNIRGAIAPLGKLIVNDPPFQYKSNLHKSDVEKIINNDICISQIRNHYRNVVDYTKV